MSQDLLDKQIELLERKYGGRGRSNNAARIIQRAFRHYSMRRKFATITAMAKADQRRLSRRIHNELVDSAWSSGGLDASLNDSGGSSSSAATTADDSVARAEYVIRTNFASLVRELNEEGTGVRSSSRSMAVTAAAGGRQQVRMSPQQQYHHQHFYHHHHHHHNNHMLAGHYQYQHSFDSSHYVQPHHHAYGSGSASTSPAPPPPLPTSVINGGGMTGPVAPASHSPYGNHHHLHNHQQNFGHHNHKTSSQGHAPPAEFRRSDSKSSAGLANNNSSSGCSSSSSSNNNNSKRVPPEVPRRTSSALSSNNSQSALASNQGSFCESPHPRQQQQHRSQTPSLPDAIRLPDATLTAAGVATERRTSNLSAEHSTSEDSLEGAGYSNIFWSENGGTGHLHHSVNAVSSGVQSHSSPVPFPPLLQYDRINGTSGTATTATAPATGTTTGQPTPAQAKVLESIRKRQYRVGLNLFNKKPERGVAYLTQKGFLEASPRAVAKFFITRKGVSKQMIGEYLGNLQNPFNMAALDFFIEELDFAGLEVDVALRRFQTYFRMPGEAQKIERLMEVFGQRYCQCNPQVVARLRNPDTIFILAFAVIMLNTDLHTPSIKGRCIHLSVCACKSSYSIIVAGTSVPYRTVCDAALEKVMLTLNEN